MVIFTAEKKHLNNVNENYNKTSFFFNIKSPKLQTSNAREQFLGMWPGIKDLVSLFDPKCTFLKIVF